MRSTKVLFVIVLLLVLGIETSHAQSQVGGTSPLDVFVEVQGVCEVFTEPVAFPAYDGATGIQSEGYIHVNCVRELPYWIALDIGQNYQPDYDARGMAGPSGFLAYYLFTIDGQLWGDRGMPFITNSWDAFGPVIGTGVTDVWPVIGEIPGGQASAPGFYLDTVNVTIWY